MFVSEKFGILVCWENLNEFADSLEPLKNGNCPQLVFDYLACSAGLYDLKERNAEKKLGAVLDRMKTLLGKDFDPRKCTEDYKGMITNLKVKKINLISKFQNI